MLYLHLIVRNPFGRFIICHFANKIQNKRCLKIKFNITDETSNTKVWKLKEIESGHNDKIKKEKHNQEEN